MKHISYEEQTKTILISLENSKDLMMGKIKLLGITYVNFLRQSKNYFYG